MFVPGRKPYEPKTRFALCLYVTGEAKNLREAGDKAGMIKGHIHNVSSSEKGKNLIAQLEALFLKGMGKQAVRNINWLQNQRQNLNVAMRASEWASAINGLAPTQRHEMHHSGAVAMVGLTIVLPPLDQPQITAPDSQSGAIEGQAVEVKGKLPKA